MLNLFQYIFKNLKFWINFRMINFFMKKLLVCLVKKFKMIKYTLNISIIMFFFFFFCKNLIYFYWFFQKYFLKQKIPKIKKIPKIREFLKWNIFDWDFFFNLSFGTSRFDIASNCTKTSPASRITIFWA